MVDIIIPVYNALDTLELAVTSALMQGDVRILLVDDGSTDGTARLCDELAHHPRIAVIHQRNRGGVCRTKRRVTSGSIGVADFS